MVGLFANLCLEAVEDAMWKGVKLMWPPRHPSYDDARRPLWEGRLTAIKGLIVAANVGLSEGVTIGAIGAECGIVTGSVVIGTIMLWVIGETVVEIASSSLLTHAKAVVLGALDQRWSALVRSGCVSSGGGVVRMLSAAGGEESGCANERECNKTKGLHRVLTIHFGWP